MSVSVYLDTNYSGDSRTLQGGDYDRQYLRDISYGNFESNISSIRVDRNTLVLLSSSSSPTGSGNNRVVIGPQNISDLSTIGFDDSVNSLKIRNFRESDWGTGAAVSIFNNYNYTGQYKNLRGGDYNAARLAANEDNRSGITDIRSLTVDNNTIAILYDGDNFDGSMNSVYIEGPAQVDDLSKYNLDNKLSSIRVYSTDSVPSNLPKNDAQWGPSVSSHKQWYDDQWDRQNSRDPRTPIGSHGGDYVDPRQMGQGVSLQDYKITKKQTQLHPTTANQPIVAKVHDVWSEQTLLGVKYGVIFLVFMIIIITAILTATVVARQVALQPTSILEKIVA